MENESNLPSKIWHFKGKDQSGPNVLVLGAVHGDEKAAVKSIKYFLKKLGVENKPGVYERDDVIGNFYIGFGNPAAIKLDQRCVEDDLNRIMYPEIIDSDPTDQDSEDLKRARELAPLLQKIDYFFDIHTTSSKTVPYIGMSSDDNSERNRFCKFIPAKYILTDPNRCLAQNSDLKMTPTMDAYVGLYGGIGIIYETENTKNIPDLQKGHVVAVRLLREFGVIKNQFIEDLGVQINGDDYKQDVYAFEKRVVAKDDSFKYEHGKIRNWQSVKKDEVIGEYADGEKVMSPIDGMIVFPSIPGRIKAGESLLYFAKKIGLFGVI